VKGGKQVSVVCCTGADSFVAGLPAVVEVDMVVRSMGPISEVDMVRQKPSHPFTRVSVSPARNPIALQLYIDPLPFFDNTRVDVTKNVVFRFKGVIKNK